MLSDIRFSKHAAWGRNGTVPSDALMAVRTTAFALGLMDKMAEKRHAAKLLTQDEANVFIDIAKSIKEAKALVARVNESTIKVASANLDAVIAHQAIDGALSMDKIAAGPEDMLGGAGDAGGAGAATQEMNPALLELLKKILGQGGMPGAEGMPGGDEMAGGDEGGEEGGKPGADQMPSMMAGGAPGAEGGMDEQMLAELMKRMQMPKGASADDDHATLLTKALQTPAASLGLPRMVISKTASKVKAPMKKLAEMAPETNGAVNSFQRAADYLGLPAAMSTFIGRGPTSGLNVGLLSLLPAA